MIHTSDFKPTGLRRRPRALQPQKAIKHVLIGRKIEPLPPRLYLEGILRYSYSISGKILLGNIFCEFRSLHSLTHVSTICSPFTLDRHLLCLEKLPFSREHCSRCHQIVVHSGLGTWLPLPGRGGHGILFGK